MGTSAFDAMWDKTPTPKGGGFDALWDSTPSTSGGLSRDKRLRRALARQRLNVSEQEFAEIPSPLQAVAQSVGQGLTTAASGMPGGKLALSALRSMTGPESFKDAERAINADVESYASENPKAALALQVAGSLPLTGAVGRVGSAAKALAGGSRLAEGAAIGGTMAGATRALDTRPDESLGDRAAGTLTDTALGAGLGAALPKLMGNTALRTLLGAGAGAAAGSSVAPEGHGMAGAGAGALAGGAAAYNPSGAAKSLANLVSRVPTIPRDAGALNALAQKMEAASSPIAIEDAFDRDLDMGLNKAVVRSLGGAGLGAFLGGAGTGMAAAPDRKDDREGNQAAATASGIGALLGAAGGVYAGQHPAVTVAQMQRLGAPVVRKLAAMGTGGLSSFLNDVAQATGTRGAINRELQGIDEIVKLTGGAGVGSPAPGAAQILETLASGKATASPMYQRAEQEAAKQEAVPASVAQRLKEMLGMAERKALPAPGQSLSARVGMPVEDRTLAGGRPLQIVEQAKHGIRDEAGKVRRNLSGVSDRDLMDEYARIAQKNAQEEGEATAIRETPEYYERSELLGGGHIEDAADFLSPDQLNTLSGEQRNRMIRDAQAKLLGRIDAEMTARQKANRVVRGPDDVVGDVSFDFGANAPVDPMVRLRAANDVNVRIPEGAGIVPPVQGPDVLNRYQVGQDAAARALNSDFVQQRIATLRRINPDRFNSVADDSYEMLDAVKKDLNDRFGKLSKSPSPDLDAIDAINAARPLLQQALVAKAPTRALADQAYAELVGQPKEWFEKGAKMTTTPGAKVSRSPEALTAEAMQGDPEDALRRILFARQGQKAKIAEQVAKAGIAGGRRGVLNAPLLGEEGTARQARAFAFGDEAPQVESVLARIAAEDAAQNGPNAILSIADKLPTKLGFAARLLERGPSDAQKAMASPLGQMAQRQTPEQMQQAIAAYLRGGSTVRGAQDLMTMLLGAGIGR